MKNFLGIGILTLVLVSCNSYTKDEKGITLKVKDTINSCEKIIRLDVVSDDIIRVQSYPDKKIALKESLMIIDSLNLPTPDWKLADENDTLYLSTSTLLLKISKTSGKIAFFNSEGNLKLAEGKEGVTKFTPEEIEGETLYKVQQTFDSPDDEAFYGLGQHQNGQMNYKGQDVDVLQHNIVSVVPFLVSSKNYGILWDNYSHTKFGDPRDYEPISILKLYGKDEQPGGLTATYYADLDKKEIYTTRSENKIYYKFLDNMKDFPAGFNLAKGMVEWDGYIEASETGKYKFMAYSAGYMKLWVDNNLIFDCWRQCWNPWGRIFSLPMEPGKKVKIHIEWIPDAGESYMAFECLSPISDKEQNMLSLYSEAARKVDYYFINGNNIDEIIRGYRTITGKAPIMPEWAMGLWQSRERYKTQDELIGVVKEYRKRNIPLDNIVLDWQYWPEDKWGDHGFDYARFPNPEGMMEELHNQLHTNLMISVWAKYYENCKNYQIMKDRGWLYMQNIINKQKDWVGPGYVSTFYDAYNADARKEFWRQINDSLFSRGVDAWWLDATEPDVLSNTSIPERKKLIGPTAMGSSTEFINPFSLVQTQAVYEGQRNVSPNQRVFILTRSAYAGQQRYSAATWSGDVASRWSDLKEQIAAGVNFCISGIPYWTTDIGGFAMETRYMNPNAADLEEWRELNMRWYQFGVFCPLFRIHGQFPYREIYNTSPEGHPVYKSMVYYDKLRYKLMPYIYSLSGMTYFDDYTIMRALIMDHAVDKNVLNIADEFMFGPSLLVCPVYDYKVRDRKVYLPSTSNWYNLLSGEFFEGGKEYTVAAPLEKIPVFVKEGAIVPVGPDIQYVNEKLADPITLFVFEGKDGSFALYED
jgi:alpha-D-xyloside xylohydrolase